MHNEHHHDEPGFPHASAKPTGLKRAGVIVAVAAILLVATGIWARANKAGEVQKWTNERAVPSVSVLTAKDVAAKSELVLPGRLEAYSEAPIFARVSGYLKKWNVDIGTQVRAGQLLAEIDTPELYQQLEQAKADLANAQANEALAESTAKRWKNLRATDSVSQQETDQKNSDLAVRSAAVAAAQANVSRMKSLESFKRVTAPFDGVVTSRKTDIGALINAGSGNGVELFRVADVHILRVSVRVPQNQAARIQAGMIATLTVPEHPGQTFSATLKRTSGAISTTSGTLLAELEVDNKEGKLTPGAYAEIKLGLAADNQTKRVPASALILRKGGVQLAVVGKDNRVVMKKIQMGRDFGSEIEVLSGLDPDDRIIDSPPDSLEDGELVRIEVPPPAKPDNKPAPGQAKS